MTRGVVPRPSVLASILASLVLVALPARALDARAEAAAKDALKKAAGDFASGGYATALARLDRAATTCGVSRCSRATKAFVLRDLGTMQLRAGDKAASANSYAEALKIEPELDLPAKYNSPDVRAAWDRAKGVASAGRPVPATEQPSGDFTHTPPAEQKVRTPLPLYVEYPGSPAPAKVVVKYKGAGMSEWGRVDLARADEGWEGMIPCADVARGTMRYWIQGVDRQNSPMASSGDPKHPYVVPIRPEISGEAPHLPDKPAPRACSGGTGGEEEEASGGGAGEGGGSRGGGGGGGGGGGRGSASGESASGEGGGREEEPRAKAPPRHGKREDYAHLWVGASLAIDFVSMPAAQDVCMLNPSSGEPTTPSELYCTNPDGTDFPSRANNTQNMHLVTGQAGQTAGGLQPGDVRIMLSVDYAVVPNVLVGGRMGYVANAYTGSAASKDGRAAGFKIHIEGRATYLLGDQPLGRIGFVPMGFAGLGLAEFDAHSSTVVRLDNVAGVQPVNVWRTDGPFFLMLGAGARYNFSPRVAFTGAARLDIAVGNGALLVIGPELGVEYGF